MRRKNKPQEKVKRIPARFRPGAVDRFALKKLKTNQDENDYEQFGDFDYPGIEIVPNDTVTKWFKHHHHYVYRCRRRRELIGGLNLKTYRR